MQRLIELALAEEEAVASRRWDDLLSIQEEQRDLLEELSEALPEESLPALELALARSQATQQSLVGAMAETQGIMERLRSGRRTIGAYGLRHGTALEARA